MAFDHGSGWQLVVNQDRGDHSERETETFWGPFSSFFELLFLFYKEGVYKDKRLKMVKI